MQQKHKRILPLQFLFFLFLPTIRITIGSFLAVYVQVFDLCFTENDQIEPEGMEELCKAIGVQPDDIVMLILAQKLNAQNMGFFTLEEWTKGMQSLQ